MNFDIEKLKQAVESEGCTLIKSLQSETVIICCIMLPDSFPWTGGDFDVVRRKNSRIIARVTMTSHSCKWMVWPEPEIIFCLNKPLGIEMHENDSVREVRDVLKKYSYEQIAAWLVEKIGEVSKKAKECRKLMITYKSKEFEA